MEPESGAVPMPSAPGAGAAAEAGWLRGPLDAAPLTSALVTPGGLWTSVEVVRRTASTNADLLARVGGGRGRPSGREGQILIAEEQTAGRGRLGRSWVSPPGAALTFSVLLRPVGVPPGRRGWLPLLAGIAVASAVRTVTGLGARLKWPNDVLIGDRKLAGVLAEASGTAVVVGIGLNVSSALSELPAGSGGLGATSLLVERSPTLARQPLLIAVLGALERRYLALCADPRPEANGLLDEYRALSATLGRQIRVELPGGVTAEGQAADIDPVGRLLLAERRPAGTPAGGRVPRAIAAGDVIHVR